MVKYLLCHLNLFINQCYKMNTYNIYKSSLKTKKYDVYKNNKKVVSFGGAGYTDYTINNDNVKKQNYIKRHKINEDWTDLNKAGTWSRYILWNQPTLKKSVDDMEHKFNIKINIG